MKSVLSIGWDVGGWLGRKNALAVACSGPSGVRWAGAVRAGELPEHPGELGALVEAIAGAEVAHAVRDGLRRDIPVVVAIDAPLGLPDAYRAFLTDPDFLVKRPERFIDHPLAFRKTDREIVRFLGKEPLSATFDKLGNPASVAITFARRWRKEGFSVVTAAGTPVSRAIIEVYPSLAKQRCAVRELAMAPYRPHLDAAGVLPGTDGYDASLCALLGLGFAIPDHPSLPALLPAEGSPTEGAIWYPADPKWRGTCREQP